MYNAGMGKLAVNTSVTPTQLSPPAYAVVLQPEEEIEKAAQDLGIAGDRYLIITNLDQGSEGEITINIVKQL